MNLTPDQVLAELQTIGERLGTMEPDDPERVALEVRRNDLRRAAREAADAARDPDSLRAELEHLQRRLTHFEGEKINVPAWQMSMSSGGRFSINDPAAHAYKLNQALDEATAMDRQTIEDRIEAIKRVLAE